MDQKRRKHCFFGFLIGIILLGGGFYLAISPFLPTLMTFTSAFHAPSNEDEGFRIVGKVGLAAEIKGKTPPPALQKFSQENRLVIPSIGVDYHVLEGKSDAILDKGFWHRPHTSMPDQGGNTVIAGHRYQFISGPHTMFSLDKVKIGDRMTVFWNGKEYDYEVTETKVVPPTAIQIEYATPDARLTVYSCTPIFTTKDRLVVIGKLIPNETGSTVS